MFPDSIIDEEPMGGFAVAFPGREAYRGGPR